jgi:NADH-quinone oxidoreductase subunit N
VFNGTIDLPMILAILPEILLLILGAVILIADVVTHHALRRNLGWVTAVGLGLIIVASLLFARPGLESPILWGGMIRYDWLGFIFKLMFIFGAAVTALFAMDYPHLGGRGEFYVLLLASTIGMNLMASANDLILLYLAIETTSIPMYALAGFISNSTRSTEAGYKYLLFGALTSAVMLYGFSLLYGFGGHTNFNELINGFRAENLPFGVVFGALVLVLVGFGFKISVFPLHFWAPDVYEGAPTPVAGFLSTASKAAGFAVLARVMLAVFSYEGAGIPGMTFFQPAWIPILYFISVASMTIGNLIALAQRNIKRLLAYSSIAHAGYALIGLVAYNSDLGVPSLVFYLLAYLVTNLAAFGVVAAASRITGSDEIASFAGLSRRAPYLALIMLVAFLSLAGMPPFGGFVAKVFIFAAAVSANQIPLAVIAVLNSIVGLYYYLIVIKVIYLYQPDPDQASIPIVMTRPYALALGVLSVAIVLIGSFFAPWFDFAATAANVLRF